MRFAQRTAWGTAVNALTLRIAERRAAGLPVLNLTETNPTRCGFPTLPSDVMRALRPRDLDYAPDPRGLASAREAIAADYAARGLPVDPDRLILTAGTSEAYSHLFRLLADPGDRVLVPVPSYPLFDLLCRIHDIGPAGYPLLCEGGFSIDREALRAAIDPVTRAIVIVNPGNPTGTYVRPDEAASIAAIAGDHGVPLISDEVFGDFAIDADPVGTRSLAALDGPTTFVLNGLSKMLAMPGLKLAWILVAGPEDPARAALERLEILSDTFLSVGTPVQQALPDLLRLRARLQAPLRARLRENLSWLRDRLREPGPCSVLPVEAGWSVTLSVPRTRDDEAWALRLLESDGVLVHPGWFFDFPEEGRLVISLLPEPASFRDGCERLIERIRRESS